MRGFQMSTAEYRNSFICRFDRIWAQARKVQVSQAICWAVLTLLAGISLLAAADFWLELSLSIRQGAVLGIAIASLSIATYLVFQSLHRWRRQATAATLEHVFPQLGQRIRTTVECAGLNSAQIQRSGIDPSLVAAL